MTPQAKDFYGKEVAEAIKKACKALQVPQEQLDIEVVETGSTGIFGLIRKKAHIKVTIKGPETFEEEEEQKPAPKKPSRKTNKRKQPSKNADPPAQVEDDKVPSESRKKVEPPSVSVTPEESRGDETDVDEQDDLLEEETEGEIEELSEQTLEMVRQELSQMLELMGYPSPVEVSAKGNSVHCHVGDEHEEVLAGQDGKTLDAIQYLLRKIVVRKAPNRLRVTVDIGNYREKRLAELKEQALELAIQVKADGKTQVIAALSPSERRVIHMSLQDDKEIRSRSVGEGLFKKILIYKPGKGNKGGGRKRNSSRGRRSSGNGRKKST